MSVFTVIIKTEGECVHCCKTKGECVHCHKTEGKWVHCHKTEGVFIVIKTDFSNGRIALMDKR